MKYGDSLHQRSVPLWETYNVDYNDIKRLIKVRTTPGPGQARAIPGGKNEAKQLQEFEEEFYQELREQHQRVDLFVQSKTGEIGRRLAHLDKQIAHLKIRSFASGQRRISIRRLEKFSKLEGATLKAGEEIQSLSRFVGAQGLAFQKLLKKYTKWTGSPTLGKRFREGVLDCAMSCSRREFQPLLALWTEVLASVRAPFDDNSDRYPAPSKIKEVGIASGGSDIERSRTSLADTAPTYSSAEELHSICESGCNVDLDTALAIIPSGPGAAKAVYWIHPDNIVQLHVLLLQYTKLPKRKSSESPFHTPPSPGSLLRASPQVNSKRPFTYTDEEVGVIVCDDLQRFAQRRNSEVISEDKPGNVTEKAAASIRYSCSGDAVAVVGTIADNDFRSAQSHTRPQPSKATFERKVVCRLFDPSQFDRLAKESDSEDLKRVCRWFNEHQEVQPLVQLQSRRIRFVGLANSKRAGIWATLDTDILMTPSSRESVAEGIWLKTVVEAENSKSFPHAVLEVRIEGGAASDLVSRLDDSHLTERVRGFSLETHAVATLCRPHGMSRPFWLPALGQDIRKIPAASGSTKGRASEGQVSPGPLSTRHTSLSATSTTQGPSSGYSGLYGASSATSAPDLMQPQPPSPSKQKRRRSHRRQILEKRLSEQCRVTRRYWNEFDDGSEGSDNEAYTILVDPNTSSSIPGTATITKFFRTLTSTINVTARKVTTWSRSSGDPNCREREPLVDSIHSPSFDASDISDVEASPNPGTSGIQRYSTFAPLAQRPATRARKTLLFRSCLASFTASFVLLIVSSILETTGRRKAETTVDAGVIIGVASSLVFAIIAVGSTLGRKDDVGWVHRVTVCLLFVCVAIGAGGLIARLGRA